MDLGLRDKRIVVTAASRGLGFAVAKGFAMDGAEVIISSRDEQNVRRAVASLREVSSNERVFGYPADVTAPVDLERFFDAVRSNHGDVDVLVANAGGPVSGGFDSITEQQWKDAYELTLMSVVRLVHQVLPGMRKNGFGRIVAIESASVKEPMDDLILSNTFRLAVVGLMKSLSRECASDGILVNTVGPGRIATDRIKYLDERRTEKEGISADEIAREWAGRIPVGRYGHPDEFAGMAVFLGSPANRYITGQTVLVDGGMVRAL